MPAGRWAFEKVGLGYHCWSDEIQTHLRLTKIKRSRDELTGDLAIETNIKGTKSQANGLFHRARFNASSSPARSSLAKTLGQRTPGQDMDWADALEALCQGVMSAEEQGEPAFELNGYAVASPHEKWLVEPIVLKELPTLLFGPGGVSKSAIALTIGISVSAGRELIPGMAPSIKGHVLYLDWETSPRTMAERMELIKAGYGFDPYPGFFYSLRRNTLDQDVEDVAALVAEHKVVLTIVDSAAWAMGPQGEHGDASDAAIRLFRAIRYLNTACLVIDHLGKADVRGRPGTGQAYGSVYKTNIARQNIEVRRDAAAVRLYQGKTNVTAMSDEPIFSLALEWTDEKMVFRTAAAPEPAADELTSMKDLILDHMSDGAKRTPATVAKELDLNPSSVRVKMRELANVANLSTGDGLYWLSTANVIDFRGGGVTHGS